MDNFNSRIQSIIELDGLHVDGLIGSGVKYSVLGWSGICVKNLSNSLLKHPESEFGSLGPLEVH